MTGGNEGLDISGKSSVELAQKCILAKKRFIDLRLIGCF